MNFLSLMPTKTMARFLEYIGAAQVFFFCIFLFFVPMSNAVVESCFGFLFVLFLVRLSLGQGAGVFKDRYFVFLGLFFCRGCCL